MFIILLLSEIDKMGNAASKEEKAFNKLYKKSIVNASNAARRRTGPNFGPNDVTREFSSQVSDAEQNVKDAKTEKQKKIAEEELHKAQILYDMHLQGAINFFGGKI